MTEILIQEISIKEQKSMDENLRSRFVGEWLQNENVIINTNFVERGRRMGLEITNPRRVIIISVLTMVQVLIRWMKCEKWNVWKRGSKM